MEKVSVIVPCFNVENYIERFLDSITSQTYKNIELILINDGSTDNTEKKIKTYLPKLINKGIIVKYISQENQGAAAAINRGLEIFSGDYLMWVDSDDVLMSENIEKKVEFLNTNLNYGIVRTDGIIVHEDNVNIEIGRFAKENPNKYKEDLFLDYIIEHYSWLACGCFMVTREALLNSIPTKKIYESRGGQNWQILLPVLYNYKCGFIDLPLYKYIVRENSHSHSVKRIEDQILRCDVHEDILLKTLYSIKMDTNKKQKYYKIIENKYKHKRFNLALKLDDTGRYQEFYKKIEKKSFKVHLKYLLAKLRLLNLLLK